jgi:hypothetical protein
VKCFWIDSSILRETLRHGTPAEKTAIASAGRRQFFFQPTSRKTAPLEPMGEIDIERKEVI